MKIAVCVRQGLDGELGPFDASAYEAALGIEGAEVILLSMGALPTGELLTRLSRLGASRAVLLCDKAFAGADTLATAYALSLALKHLEADFVFCGRQTLIGDTAQTPPMLSHMLGYSFLSGVMSAERGADGGIVCVTRDKETFAMPERSVIAFEKSYKLRLPRLRSMAREVEILHAADVSADVSRCGLGGSPTRVLESFENQSGKRKCTFMDGGLYSAIQRALEDHEKISLSDQVGTGEMLPHVCAVGQAPLAFAERVSENVTVLPMGDAESVIGYIKEQKPTMVLFGSDERSKTLAATVAASLSLGLCADCTHMAYENGEPVMYRPALSGSVIAKIRSITSPALATVRTDQKSGEDVVIGVGYGARNYLSQIFAFAEKIGAKVMASRKLVDNGYMPYECQVGLTGVTVSPKVYVAIGISGAVHHIMGMQRAGTVIAVNPDRQAPIFEYADFGIAEEIESVLY